MKNEIKLVFATEEDSQLIIDTMAYLHSQMENQNWFYPDKDEDVKAFIKEEGFAIKAMAGEELAGFFFGYAPGLKRDNMGSYLEFDEENLKKVGHMETAMVHAKFRGRGLQKRLMEAAEKKFQEMGYVHLFGTVHPDNVFSVNNFHKLGYTEVARVAKYGGLLRSVYYKKQ